MDCHRERYNKQAFGSERVPWAIVRRAVPKTRKDPQEAEGSKGITVGKTPSARHTQRTVAHCPEGPLDSPVTKRTLERITGHIGALVFFRNVACQKL